MIKRLKKEQVEKVQIDEGVIFVDFGVPESEYMLGPTRGGGEFSASMTLRDIDFDGRHGRTAGMRTIDEQEAHLAVKTLCCSQKDLLYALPGVEIVTEDGKNTIQNPKCGIIETASYQKNITMFAQTLDKKYKVITLYNALDEAGISIKAVQKSENEFSLDFYAHYTTDDLDGKLYDISEVDVIPETGVASAE
ncbi:MAG: hypothetical protein ACI3XR_08570 [Eubacteriales bacterium]